MFEEIRGIKHIAFFYHSEEEWQKGIISLIKEALESGKRVIYIYYEHDPEQILKLLNLSFFNEKISNQICFLKAYDFFSKKEHFTEKIIKILKEETQKAYVEGLFVTVEMISFLEEIENVDRVKECEHRLCQEFFDKIDYTLICQYDWRRIPSRIICDLVKRYPYFIYENELIRNFFYVSKVELTEEENRIWFDRILKLSLIEKALEERVKELEKIFFDEPHIGFFIAADFPPKILIANRGFREILGFSEKETDFISQIHESDRDLFIEGYKNILSKRDERVTTRIKFINKDGELIGLRIIITPINFNNIDCVKVCFVDITEQLIKEEEMDKLREQLFLAQKMESIGRLASGIAHDFNNILTAIKGFTQLAQMKITEHDPIMSYLNNIKSSAEKAEKLIKQLLAFSKKQILQPKVINLNDLINGIKEMLKRVIGEDILLITELEQELGLVEVDPTQMEIVIMNLVTNARDAMPQGGTLTIETKNVYLDDEYVNKHFGFEKGAYVMLSVSDTGVGIPEEIKDKIFEPFFTTKPEIGSGLGLSTVYGIVKQHGGNINVYSELYKGTTFKIYLPRVDKPSEQIRFDIREEEKSLTGSETILVIDDDDSVRAVILEMLKKLGYKTLEAKDYDTAIFFARFYDKNIDLLISDVVLPGISGPKLLERIKVYRPEIKVLYISGYTDNVISHHGILKKGVNFIQKPFSIQEFARKIREILDKQED